MTTDAETDAIRSDADSTEQRMFAASAAALVASHTMADAVWQTYFPELPAKQPELRTVLMDLHRCALLNKSPNLSDARDMIEKRFGIEAGTAKNWTNKLEKLGFLVRMEDKKEEKRALPGAISRSQIRAAESGSGLSLLSWSGRTPAARSHQTSGC